jgi:cytochrome P450
MKVPHEAVLGIAACKARLRLSTRECPWAVWTPAARISGTLSAMPPDIRHFELVALPEGFYDDPFPYYRALREADPVHRFADGGIFLTRYADVLSVYKDVQRFASDKTREFRPKFGDGPLYQHHTTSLVFNDPPRHTRVRRLIIGALSPKAIEMMRPALERWVDHLLELAPKQQPLDLIEHFAAAIPIEVIGNLLDVPITDRGPLREWSLAILSALEPALSAAQLKRGNDAVDEFCEYLRTLIERRRATPGNPQEDVLTRLIFDRDVESGEPLSEQELLHNCIFLLNAGHETTTNLIGNALVLLDQHRDQRARLLAEPALINTCIEEVLRYESSNQLGNRMTTAEVEIGGARLDAGTPVHLCIGAANRDPAQFPEPERFDIARDPNRHVAFASGIHQCAGMNLARLEGRVALLGFLKRFPNYRLSGPPIRSRRARFRGFLGIPAELG